MIPPVIDASRLRELVSIPDAVQALADLFAGPRPATPHRTGVACEAGDVLVMAAHGPRTAGVKVLGIAPRNPQAGLPVINGVFVLLDPQTLRPSLLADGAALTALRTSALSALATSLLARPDARRLVVFGAGPQARAHIQALLTCRPTEDVRLASKDPDRAARIVTEARALGLPARTSSPDDIGDADIICTCTSSATPLFDGANLAPGVHINAIGSYQPDRRELDNTTIRRCRLVVEDRSIAFLEAGGLAIPAAAGWLRPADVTADLAELIGGAVARTSSQDITVFKSVGMAHEDLAVALDFLGEDTTDRSHATPG